MGEYNWSIFKCNSRPFNFLRSMFSTRTEKQTNKQTNIITEKAKTIYPYILRTGGIKIKYAHNQEADEQLVITGTSHTMSGNRVRKVL